MIYFFLNNLPPNQSHCPEEPRKQIHTRVILAALKSQTHRKRHRDLSDNSQG